MPASSSQLPINTGITSCVSSSLQTSSLPRRVSAPLPNRLSSFQSSLLPLDQSLSLSSSSSTSTSPPSLSLHTFPHGAAAAHAVSDTGADNEGASARATLVLQNANKIQDLAEYTPAAEPNFQWGSLKREEFRSIIRLAYDEVVHWRRNIFLLPSGKVGKEFIRVLTSLFTAYSQGSALESVALEAVMVACVLLLQKPHSKSKSKDHVRTLERHLRAWHGG